MVYSINTETASTKELVEFYNKHAHELGKREVKKFVDRATAQLRVRQLIEDLVYTTQAMEVCQAVEEAVKGNDDFHQVTEEQHIFHRAETVKPVKVPVDGAWSETREAMKTSLKLDRTIVVYEGDELQGTWSNAFRMWKDNPEWMTSGQQDRLTAKLYAAAKQGEKIQVEINGRTFELANV